MKTDRHCRWIRHRLPLLAGGELAVEERRKVERHLIGCPGCRTRRDASSDALSALRSLAGDSPSSLDAPSLWPALATQIRQSRHASPRSLWWEVPLPRPWTLVGLATGFGAVLAASIASSPSPPTDFGPGEAPGPTIAAQPSVVESESESEFEFESETPLLLPSVPKPWRGALPESPPNRLSQNFIKPIEPPSTLQFDYDLDHGTPMSPGNHDPQRTY